MSVSVGAPATVEVGFTIRITLSFKLHNSHLTSGKIYFCNFITHQNFMAICVEQRIAAGHQDTRVFK